MKNKLISVLFIFMFILSFAVFVSAANSDGLLQIWRNASTGANVSYVDNNGNWFSSGNFNLSGIYYGNGAGLTNLNVSALDLSGYVPYTGSSKNVVLGNYNFSVGTSKLFVNYNTGNVGIGTTSPGAKLDVRGGSWSSIRNEMSIWLANNGVSGETDWTNNAYYSSGWKYRLADEASRIQMVNGKTTFSSAVVGTADGALTWTDNVAILQNGNVGIGTVSPGAKLDINGGIMLNTTTTKPTCSLSTRGTMWYERSASGTDDFMYACMRDSTGTVAWVMVARAS